jgi:hypothetical protein
VWDRGVLVAAVGHRLAETDRRQLADTEELSRLVEPMSAAGVLAPATMLHVLHAEGVDAVAAAALVPAIGMGTSDAIRVLHDIWGADRLDTAAVLGATAEELRAAGCTAVELLAAAPRETLRSLDARESTWQRVGPSLLEAGYSQAEAIAHLAAHAPTPETFAVGVTTIIDDPLTAFAYSARRAGGDDLAVLSERYGLAPAEAAAVFASAGVALDRAIEATLVRCEHDVDATYELAVGVLGADESYVTAVLAGDVANVVGFTSAVPHGEAELVEVGVGYDAGMDQ